MLIREDNLAADYIISAKVIEARLRSWVVLRGLANFVLLLSNFYIGPS